MNDDFEYSVLIVDDERANLDVLSAILEPSHTVLVAKSGEDALAKAHADRPDIILLDIVMPGMNGFDTLAELKKSEETRRIPVIIITGLDSVEDEERGLILGAADYITKPFHGAIVKARVGTHLQMVSQIRQLEQLGMVDALTGIPNRRSFDARIEAEWRRAHRDKSPLSLLTMDIDKFKVYNDTYGHPQGDVLLRQIAKLFTRTLKRPADFAARTGGEEFAVLLPNTDAAGAAAIGEELRAAVEAAEIPLLIDGTLTRTTVSVGAATVVPSDETSIADLIAASDKMVYQAKNTGRNRVCP